MGSIFSCTSCTFEEQPSAECKDAILAGFHMKEQQIALYMNLATMRWFPLRGCVRTSKINVERSAEFQLKSKSKFFFRGIKDPHVVRYVHINTPMSIPVPVHKMIEGTQFITGHTSNHYGTHLKWLTRRVGWQAVVQVLYDLVDDAVGAVYGTLHVWWYDCDLEVVPPKVAITFAVPPFGKQSKENHLGTTWRKQKEIAQA